MLTPADAERLILENVAPFHREDCQLSGAHRRVLDEGKLTPLRQVDGERAVRVAALLRLAVRINRGREPAPQPELHVIDQRIDLVFPSGFLETHPMTRADLDEEREMLRTAGFDLSFR